MKRATLTITDEAGDTMAQVQVAFNASLEQFEQLAMDEPEVICMTRGDFEVIGNRAHTDEMSDLMSALHFELK